jgi:hypothetical protein
VTTAIAIWGAVTGTVAALAQVLLFRRDRPRLAIELSFGMRLGEPATISLAVANRGRQATTLVKVALAVAGGRYTMSPAPRGGPGHLVRGSEDRAREKLEARAARDLRADADIAAPGTR